MRLFKLIQSIDYVTYPAYRELARISDTIGNHFSNIRDAIIACIIGTLFEKAPISSTFIGILESKSFFPFLAAKLGSENLPLFTSIILAILVFLILKLIEFICARWGSNKSTKKKRDAIIHEFYSVAIPRMIKVKGLIEKMDEEESCKGQKKRLLLAQARYEVRELYGLILRLKIVEHSRNGKQTSASFIVQSRISKFAYTSFMLELLDIIQTIYNKISIYEKEAQEDIADIQAIINGRTPFMIDGVEEAWKNVYQDINSQ